ncbi:hypothetical protein [Halomonas llamarensis]|uniref:Uncharacterized protein n=1 Tax=Halomonas llamarensis TaxID=2945104 RepID=A0ABT0SVB1_9GAMM|nr:hypothetical protein [Halomonas llamarensis]MCL7931765.1 hypothetical protein [Halomonas llamarensis]
MKIINKIRIWSFIICFLSGGIAVYSPESGSFTAIKAVLLIISFFLAPVAVITTFIVLIDSAGDGLNTLQRKKDEKNKKKRH